MQQPQTHRVTKTEPCSMQQSRRHLRGAFSRSVSTYFEALSAPDGLLITHLVFHVSTVSL